MYEAEWRKLKHTKLIYETVGFAKENAFALYAKILSLIDGISPHWGLNPGPSVYKTDALPLSYRGASFHCLVACCAFQVQCPSRRRGGIEPLHVSMPRELKSRPGTSPTHPGCSRAASMRRLTAFLALRGICCVRNRQRGDSNPCGQSPMDF